MSEPLLVVDRVSKQFDLTRGVVLARQAGVVHAVQDVSFLIGEGETLGLVGESGSGKSTTAGMVLGLVPPSSGTVRFRGADVHNPRDPGWADYRRSVQAVFQDPYNSLSPRMKVRDIIAEPLIINAKMRRVEIDRRVAEVVEQVGLAPETPRLYPHEFSGGQRQRIALARALVLKPKLIVLDEPVSGLDVSMKAQVLNLLKDMQKASGLSYLLISHNLADVRYLCDTMLVMYLGRVVEAGTVEQVFSAPKHPYTRALLSAALPLDPDANQKEEIVLVGEVPSASKIPSGCAFHPRCPDAMAVCSRVLPVLTTIENAQAAACHLYPEELAAAGVPLRPAAASAAATAVA